MTTEVETTEYTLQHLYDACEIRRALVDNPLSIPHATRTWLTNQGLDLPTVSRLGITAEVLDNLDIGI